MTGARLGWAVLLALVLSGCAGRGPAPEIDGERTPQTYAGLLPCADCPGIRATLTLFPDGGYRLRYVYLERASEFYELGRWGLNADGSRLRLSQRARSLDYQVLPGRLRQLDQRGQVIESPFNHDLTRLDTVDTLAGPMPLRGLFTLSTDLVSATLVECDSGQRLPVRVDRSSDAFVALERAYRRAANLGDPALVRISGRFEGRADSPQVLRVEGFGIVELDHNCDDTR